MAGNIKKENVFMRYYDKLIFVVVLLLLLGSLAYLALVAMSGKKDEEQFIEKLNLRQTAETPKPLSLAKYESAAKALQSPMHLEIPDGQKASFITPERRVQCEECRFPIPSDAKTCIFCGKEQMVMPAAREDLDSDGDGIPDKVELAWGLDPNDPADAKGDLDSDGFTNLDEFLAKTDPKDPKSHPALINMLRVKEMRTKKMPVVLKSVNKMPDGYRMVFHREGKYAQDFQVRDGEKVGDTDYQVVKFEYKVERRNDERTGLPKEYNVSAADLKRLSDGKVVTVVCGEPAKDTDVEVVIVLTVDNTEYPVLEKGKFKVREETYLVEAVDPAKVTVMIMNEATGQEKVVRKLD